MRISHWLTRHRIALVRRMLRVHRVRRLAAHRTLAWLWKQYRTGHRAANPLLYYLDYWRTVASALDDFKPAVVHAHDLNTLHAARKWSRRNGVALVYDSHELELHRNARWTRRAKLVARVVELRGIRAAKAVITVSPGIAAELARLYRIATPTVVLNSPPFASSRIVPPVDLKEAAGLAPDEKLIVYVGKVTPGRGLDVLVEALPLMPADHHIGLLGPRADAAEAALLGRASELGADGRLHLLAPLPAPFVPAALSTADASVNPCQNVCRSYDLQMPNKLFDAVMAGVPVGVGQLTDLQRFIRQYEIGDVFDERDPTSIASVLTSMIARPPRGVVDRSALDELRRAVCWEEQGRALQRTYDTVTRGLGARHRPLRGRRSPPACATPRSSEGARQRDGR